MDSKQAAQKPNRLLPSLKSGLIMAVIIPVCGFASGLFKLPFRIGVNIWELQESGMGRSFPYDLKLLINIMLMALVLNIVFWIVFKNLLKKAEFTTKARFVLELCALAVILIGAMGVVFHWGFDRANYFYINDHGYDASSVNLYLYFGDEWLGHHLQHLALMSYILLLVAVESRLRADRSMRFAEIVLTIPVALVISVANGYAALLSESGLHLFILTIIVLVIEIVLIAKRRLHPRRSPILLASLVANIGVIVQNLVFISIYGLSPWYPFLRT